MIPGHKDGQVGCLAGAAVVLVEIGQLAVFGWNRHDVEVRRISDSLEIAAYDEGIYTAPFSLPA